MSGTGSPAGLRNRGNAEKKKESAAQSPRAAGNPGNMLRFYNEDAPGLMIGPVPVLVMSLVFIFSVFLLHIMGKIYRSSGSA